MSPVDCRQWRNGKKCRDGAQRCSPKDNTFNTAKRNQCCTHNSFKGALLRVGMLPSAADDPHQMHPQKTVNIVNNEKVCGHLHCTATYKCTGPRRVRPGQWQVNGVTPLGSQLRQNGPHSMSHSLEQVSYPSEWWYCKGSLTQTQLMVEDSTRREKTQTKRICCRLDCSFLLQASVHVHGSISFSSPHQINKSTGLSP